MTADAGLGPLTAAVVGLVGGVGGNLLSEVIGAAVRQLGDADNSPPVLTNDVVEQVLVAGFEDALAAGGPAGAAMRELAAALLREAGSVQTVLEGAAGADPQAVESLARGLAQLGEQFAEFAAVAGQLRAVVGALEQELAKAGAERRAGVERDRATTLILESILQAVRQPAGPGWESAEETNWLGCPYPGLAPFSAGEARLFHGRTAMTRRLVRAVSERARSGGGLMVVLGASGAGKSSLLRAGLVPALACSELGPDSITWPVRVITPGTHPMLELAAQLADLTGRGSSEVAQILWADPSRAAGLAAEALGPHLRDAADGRAVLVLVVDQLEELFAPALDNKLGQQQREGFMRCLAAMAEPTPGGQVGAAVVAVAAVRGDFLDEALRFPAVAVGMASGPFVVEPMTAVELRQAVAGPAAEAGVAIEPELVNAVLAEAFGPSRGSGAGVLPLVSQAMANTWRARRGSALTLRAYRRAGGLADAVEHNAGQALESLNSPQRKIARAMFTAMTSTGRDGRVVRQVARRTDLYAAAGVTERVGDAVIETFVERRLLISDADTVTICHDVLLDAWRQLHEWLQGDAADRILYSELHSDAAAWDVGDRDSDFLYRPRQLAAVQAAVARWEHDNDRYPPLPTVTTSFLKASHRTVRRSSRRRRVMTSILAVLTVAAFGAAGIALHNSRVAQQNAEQAQAQHAVALSRQLTATAQTQESLGNPTLARQLAVAAWQVAPTAQAGAELTALLASDHLQGTVRARGALNSVVFSPDGKTIAAGAADGTVRLWDSATGRPEDNPIRDVVGSDIGVSSVAFSPDGKTLAASAFDGTVRLWDPATGHPDGNPIRYTTASGLAKPITSVAYSPDGKTLAAGATDGTVEIWDMATSRPDRSLIVDSSAAGGGVLAVVFSPNGKTLAVGAGNGTLRMWDPATGNPDGNAIQDVSTDDTNSPTVRSVAFSPDGKTIAAASGDGMVRLWDPATDRRVGYPIEETGEYGGVLSVAFSPDGKRIAAGLPGGKLTLSNLDSGNPYISPVQIQDAPYADLAGGGGVLSVAFSPNGTMLAAGASDGTVRLWDPSTSQPVSNSIQNTTGDVRQISSVAYSPDGKTLAAGALDGTVQLWDPVTGHPRHKPLKYTSDSDVTSVAFSKDGKTLAASSSDLKASGIIRLWDLATGRPDGSPIQDTTVSDNIGYGVG